MSWDRGLILGYVAFVLTVTVSGPALAYWGHLDAVRFALCVLFVGGAGMSMAGYFRYMPAGPRISAFLGLLLGQSLAFALLGLGFLAIAVGSGGSTAITTYHLLPIRGRGCRHVLHGGLRPGRRRAGMATPRRVQVSVVARSKERKERAMTGERLLHTDPSGWLVERRGHG